MEAKPKPIFVKKVVLHNKPDIDAISAYWLARMHPNVFRGIEIAPIEFWSQSSPQDLRPDEDRICDGVVCFDVGEGLFDHHPHGRVPNKCAMDLVADYLGISDNPIVKPILDYVRKIDLTGKNTARRAQKEGASKETIQEINALEDFSLASLMADLVPEEGANFDRRMIDTICRIFTSRFNRNKRFFSEIKDEFTKKAKIQTVNANGKRYRLAIIESALREVGSFSRANEGGRCHLCINRNPNTGNVFISGRISSAQFTEIAKVLRVEELKKRDVKDEYTLSSLTDSAFPLCSVWYLPKDSKGNVFIVLNGGDKAPEVSSTVLTLCEIAQCVKLGLDESTLDESCPKVNCTGKTCPMYKFGLTRCLNIRNPSPQ